MVNFEITCPVCVTVMEWDEENRWHMCANCWWIIFPDELAAMIAAKADETI